MMHLRIILHTYWAPLILCTLHIVGVTIATSEHAFGYLDGMLLTRNLMLLFVGAFLAFMLELSEFLVVSHSSGLTLAIAGIFKVRRIHLHQ